MHWVASTISTSEVPIRKLLHQSTVSGSMWVTTNDCSSRLSYPIFRTNNVDNAIFCAQPPIGYTMLIRIFSECFKLIFDSGSVTGKCWFLWVYYDQLLQSSFRIKYRIFFFLGQEKLQDSWLHESCDGQWIIRQVRF